ncbi:Os03g0419200, partial [Oryza sativa Japonica Group]
AADRFRNGAQWGKSSKKKKKKKNKVILPPQLPPEVDDGEVVVTRVADHDDEDEVERPYEEREGNRKVAEALSLRPCKEHDDLVEGGRRIPHQDAAGEAGLQQRQEREI